MSEPREWWVCPTKDADGVDSVLAFPFDSLPEMFTQFTVGFHVIEKSAYDALKAEYAKWFAQSAVEEAALKQKCADYERALEEIAGKRATTASQYTEVGCLTLIAKQVLEKYRGRE